MTFVTINLDTLDIDEDAREFADVDRALLREIDAFIRSGGEIVPDEDEIADIATIMAEFEANPFG